MASTRLSDPVSIARCAPSTIAIARRIVRRIAIVDGLVCLYHDQALMPLKVRSPFGVVHWTLGLPFVRTSPAHGTAFDIAGRGKADPTAMTQAILFAVELAHGA